MIHCIDSQKLHIEKLDEVMDYFNKKEHTLVKAYGDARSESVQKMLGDLFSHTNHMVMSVDFVPTRKGKHDLSVYKEMERAIDKWEKSLNDGVNDFEAVFRVPSAIYSKSPITISYKDKITAILNAERKNKSYYISSLRDMARGFEQVMSVVNTKDGTFDKTSNRINKLYDKIAKAERNGNQEEGSRYINELYEILNSKDTGRVFETYVGMMENLTFEQLNNPNIKVDGYDNKTVKSLVNVVKESKNLLNKMGDVNLKGLAKTKDVVTKLYGKHSAFKKDSAVRSIDTAIERVREGMKEGKYFPHYAIQRILELENIIDSIDPSRIYRDDSYSSQVLESIEASVRKLPNEVLSSSRDKQQFFIKDPVRVLETYALNAATFNKKQFLMDAYLQAITDLNPNKTDFDGLGQIAEYMAAKYIGSTRGHADANTLVKESTSMIAKLQTVSKMALSLTGAVRNSTQHLWYMTYTGFRNYNKGRKLLNSNHTYTYNIDGLTNIEHTIDGIIDRVADDSGYFFDSASMETISKGALSNINKSDIRMSVDDQGNAVMELKADGIWRKIDNTMSDIAGKGLVMHQFTENIVRKDVYRNAFAQHFDMLFRNEHYKSKEAERLIKESDGRLSVEDAMKKVHSNIERQSHRMALNWVRMTQFEYSKEDRSLAFGGGSGNMSAIGNTLFQFFPYAANQLELNARVWKEGLQAGIRGEFNNWKFGAMVRMAAFQSIGIGLISILFNNEFRYLIENDTFNRAKKFYDLFTAEDMSDADFGNGLVQMLSGPAVADMLFWMEAAGFSDFGDDGIKQLMFGYYNLEGSAESDRERMMINRISVSAAKIYKSRESFANGDITGIIRNNFLMYPSEFTREGHAKLMDLMGVETSRSSRRKQEERVNSALLDLPQEQRERMLEVIKSINKRNEVRTGIPAGLENLTVR